MKTKNKKIIQKIAFSIPAAGLVALAGFGTMPKHVQFTGHVGHDLQSLGSQVLNLGRLHASQGNATPNITNGLRTAVGMVMGYGSRSAYVSLICQNGVDPGGNASCDGPPQNGIVGTITGFINQLPTAAKNAGITSCDSVPSSGSVTGADDDGVKLTLTFSTPTQKIPAKWTNGGTTFAHRVTFGADLTNIGPTAEAIKVAYEFNCGDSSASYTAISMAADNNGSYPGYVRDIAIFNGPVDSSNKGLEIYLGEHNPDDVLHTRTADVIRIYHNDTTKTFKLWGLIQSDISPTGGSDRQLLQKVFASGNYSTGVALAFDRGIVEQSLNGGPYDHASVIGAGGFTNASLESDPGDHDFGSDLSSSALITGAVNGSTATTFAKQGCISFNTPNTSLAPSDASCAGFSITAPDSAPYLAPNGDWNIKTLLGITAALEHVN